MEGERKYPNAHRDIKRKLSFINKKIGDLQHQRKFAYKNSAKVKKTVHNQVNQIVKCLRARERSIWTDVDETYLSQDENISCELSKLQSVLARCQVLYDHLDDNRGNIRILDNIYSILSEVNFGEKPEAKELEFISDFETMKSMANIFGHLDGDFVKKDGFIFIDKKDNSSNIVPEEFLNKKECLEKIVSLDNTEVEDSFEIVDMLENMCCEESDKESVMVEQENFEICSQQTEYVDSENGNKLLNVSKSSGNSQRAFISDEFDLEEEWKKIVEMRNKMASLSGITSKLSDESKNCEIQNTVANHFNAVRCQDKNCRRSKCLSLKETDNWLHGRNSRKDKFYEKCSKENKFSFLKDTDNWLHDRNLEKNSSKKERNFERINIGVNFDSSPAEIIRKSFTSYLTNEGIESWLLRA